MTYFVVYDVYFTLYIGRVDGYVKYEKIKAKVRRRNV